MRARCTCRSRNDPLLRETGRKECLAGVREVPRRWLVGTAQDEPPEAMDAVLAPLVSALVDPVRDVDTSRAELVTWISRSAKAVTGRRGDGPPGGL